MLVQSKTSPPPPPHPEEKNKDLSLLPGGSRVVQIYMADIASCCELLVEWNREKVSAKVHISLSVF